METFTVFIIKFRSQATTSPPHNDTSTETTPHRYETALFVETSPDRSGNIHTLGASSKTTPTDNNTNTKSSHSYTRKFQTRPETSPLFHSMTEIGVTPRALYPGAWDELLGQVPPARTMVLPMRPKSGAGAGAGPGAGARGGDGVGVQGRCAEPSCTPVTRGLGFSGEQIPASGATQWVLEKAIPMLKARGLLKEDLFR